jgi:hypothetical protein
VAPEVDPVDAQDACMGVDQHALAELGMAAHGRRAGGS